MNSLYLDRKLARLTTICAVALLCSAPLLAERASFAGNDEGSDVPNGDRYMVTITNLTYNQIISPPVVVTHDRDFRLFEPGMPASSELATLAEDGMTGPLVGLLMVSDGVFDYGVAEGGIPPGASRTVEVRAHGRAKMVSLAGMLISSNDAFVGLDGQALPSGSSRVMVLHAPAYDAGSEVNTESCDHIPGPPCGNGGVRVTDGAEEFVHVHRGIHGTGDLDAAMKDWRNPVARIEIERY